MIACYVFPQWHPNPYNDRMWSPGWTEHAVRAGAVPWFDGHRQPRTPLLGDLDESLLSTWERYNQLASDHGIDAWIFECYWAGEPIMHEALEAHLRTRSDIQFAVMWTNVPMQTPEHPDGRGYRLGAVDDPFEVRRSICHLLSTYLHRPGYLLVQGRPFVVLWNAERLAQQFDDVRALLDELRAFARSLGHADVWFHAGQASQGVYGDLEAMGFDSYGEINPVLTVAGGRPEQISDYADVANQIVAEHWDTLDTRSALPCMPAISPGWDDTPRRGDPRPRVVGTRQQWPGCVVVTPAAPEQFAWLATSAHKWLEAHPDVPQIVFVGSWNEWTEGHYLLPDVHHAYGYLRAIRDSIAGRGGFEPP